jgi:hypothetical protein
MRTNCLLLVIVILAMAAAAQASDLYSTNFESFSLGTIDGQQGWVVNGAWPLDGVILDDGTGNQVLQVTSTKPDSSWGDEVRRSLDFASTKQFITVEMDFLRGGSNNAFFFMDCGGSGASPESIFWDWDIEVPGQMDVSTNAQPTHPYYQYNLDEWHHVGIEYDSYAKKMLRFNFDGTWYDESDTTDTPAPMTMFIFRCWSPTYGGQYLWIDDLSIIEWDAPLGGDVDGNGVVDGLDLTAVLTAWNSSEGDPLWNAAADLDGSGVVDGLDLTEVISNWTTASAVPEPGTLVLIALGGAATALGRVRRRN